MHPAAPVRIFDFKYSVFRVFIYAFPAASLSSRMFFFTFFYNPFLGLRSDRTKYVRILRRRRFGILFLNVHPVISWFGSHSLQIQILSRYSSNQDTIQVQFKPGCYSGTVLTTILYRYSSTQDNIQIHF